MGAKLLRCTRFIKGAALITIGLLLGQGIAAFSAPTGTVVYSCVDRKTSVMRYSASGRCRSTERPVSWNVQGVVGARGAKGEEGPQGLQGPRGPAGESGNAVLSGTNTPTSDDGANGDFFLDTSSWRLFGPKTSSGWPAGTSLIGPTGAAGPTGPTGAAGPSGSAGMTNTVLSGTNAPSSGVGSDGDFYIDSSANRIYGPKAAGSWPTGVALIGPAGAQGTAGATGPAGANGNTVRSGTGVPPSGVGTDGDFYIDTAANMIYGPKAAGAWPSGTSLIGPQGSAGAGSLTAISAVVASRTGTSPSSYTTVYSGGSSTSLAISCYTSGGTYAYALAAKAPSGSNITGDGHLLSTAQNTMFGVVGSADGNLNRLTRGGVGPFESTNDDFYSISFIGPTINPVVVSIQIVQSLNSCTVSGYVQVGQ